MQLFFKKKRLFGFATISKVTVSCETPCCFGCKFHCFSWTCSSLLLLIVVNIFGPLVSLSSLLWQFRGLPGSTPSGFPARGRGGHTGMKRSTQPSGSTPGKPAGKVNRTGGQNNIKSRKNLFNFKPEKVKRVELHEFLLILYLSQLNGLL